MLINKTIISFFKNFMRLKINRYIFCFSIFLLLNSCQTVSETTDNKQHAYTIINSTVSASFAADGRLWRLIPSTKAMYVDYSDDFGKSYSKPIRINKKDQKISAWPENPPAIEIAPNGRIYVLYFADELQKSTSFLSISDDNGMTFSTPVLVSNHAESDMHYMDKMLVTRDNKLHLFWHDTREKPISDTAGSEGISLYYASAGNTHSDLRNQYIGDGICSCCRSATAATPEGKPVIFARMIFKDGNRDHSLIRLSEHSDNFQSQRVTHDNWNIEACPEHGPSLAIDGSGRSHLTWFTLGAKRQGIFYAHTDDYGQSSSQPLIIGDADKLPSHPDVITLNNRVIVAWKEFDGTQTHIQVMESLDRGVSWTNKTTHLSSKEQNSHPRLISNNKDIFLSWTSSDLGHQLEKI